MALLTSEKAFKVWATPMDKIGITGIEPLELQFREHEMPNDHRAKCRNVPVQLTDIISNHIDKFLAKGLFSRSNSASPTRVLRRPSGSVTTLVMR